jgi:hypothetical protein
MAWTNKYDNFFKDDHDDDDANKEEYDDEDEDDDEENRKPRKIETTARWKPKDGRHLHELALAGKIDFSKDWNDAKNKEVLRKEFTGKTDRVLTAHFNKGCALFAIAKSKAGRARVRKEGTIRPTILSLFSIVKVSISSAFHIVQHVSCSRRNNVFQETSC